jgi:poly(hydroxyalkanoate) granule-associated protein
MSSKSGPQNSTPSLGGSEAAQQIWLAGLAAFNKAQQEGGKVFDALVQEGLAMQRKAQSTTEAKLNEAGQKVSSMAQELSQRASGQWNQLEGLFEERVARALPRLGIPSAQEVQALEARVAALEAQLRSAPARKTAPIKKTPARKAAAKTSR